MPSIHPPEAAATPSRRPLWRGLAVWLLIALAETVHGTVRTIYLKPLVGDLASRQIGVATGSLMILILAYATIGWIGARDRRTLHAIGALWLGLMLGFEVGLGRLFGMSWQRIVADYLPWQGGYMLLGMAVLAAAPQVAARLRGMQDLDKAAQARARNRARSR